MQKPPVLIKCFAVVYEHLLIGKEWKKRTGTSKVKDTEISIVDDRASLSNLLKVAPKSAVC